MSFVQLHTVCYFCYFLDSIQKQTPEVFYKKVVLRNFAKKFSGKHLCQSLFFNIVAGLRPATLLKKVALAQVFSCEFCEISKITSFTEHYWTATSEFHDFSINVNIILIPDYREIVKLEVVNLQLFFFLIWNN